MRLVAATLAALALVAGAAVLGATLWSDALHEDGVGTWVPWAEAGTAVAWLVAVGGFGTVAARGVERPALRALRYLGVASVASLATLAASLVAMSRDHSAGPACNPTDAGAAAAQGTYCAFWTWFGDVMISAAVLAVCVMAFFVVGITAASTQKVWLERREYRRRFG